MKRALCALLVALGGCTRGDIENAGNAVASAAPKIANDAFLMSAVEARLFALDADSALHVAVAVRNGDVRLSGKVRDAATQQRFESEARRIHGVRRVAAQLTVDSHLPRAKEGLADFALAAGVRARIAAQAGPSGLNLRVSARAGTVTLAGRVATREVRATIAAAARQAPGVKSVVDTMEVGP